MQLAMNRIMATEVSSSMNVLWEMLNNFKEVRTMKHNPKRFDEAFNM